MNFCKYCQNYNHSWGICIRGRHQTGNDPVTGEARYSYKYRGDPRKERESLWPWRCGYRGRYFKRSNDIELTGAGRAPVRWNDVLAATR